MCRTNRRGLCICTKPNPASVAVKTDPDEIRKDIKETVEILKYGCPYEFVLKDISTVSYRPENLIVWERTVRKSWTPIIKPFQTFSPLSQGSTGNPQASHLGATMVTEEYSRPFNEVPGFPNRPLSLRDPWPAQAYHAPLF